MKFIEYVTNNASWMAFIGEGARITLAYAFFPVLLGFMLALLVSFARLSRVTMLNFAGKLYVSIIRGTPLMLQLSFAYFVLPRMLNCRISEFAACIVALSINSSAYISEVIRSGINSVDKGQFEAARSLSIPYWSMMKDIVMPQALKRVIPALTNEMINLVKESAIVGIIGEMDIMRRAQLVAADKYIYFQPFLLAGLIYYTIILILSSISRLIEIRLTEKRGARK